MCVRMYSHVLFIRSSIIRLFNYLHIFYGNHYNKCPVLNVGHPQVLGPPIRMDPLKKRSGGSALSNV